MDIQADKATEAYSRIKVALLRHNVPSGTFLNIKTIAQKIKVSPTPVREALIRLFDEEFINFAPNRGYYARHLTANDLRAEYEMAFMIAKYSIEKSQVAFQPKAGLAQTFFEFPRTGADEHSSAETVATYLEMLYQRVAMLSGNTKLVRATKMFNEKTGYIRRFGLQVAPEFTEFLQAMEMMDRSLCAGNHGDALGILEHQHRTKEAILLQVLHEFDLQPTDGGDNFEDFLN